MENNIPFNIEKHAILAEQLGVSSEGRNAEQVAQEGVELLKELSSKVGIPKMKDLKNINPENFLT
ncbi:hypothetical protein ACQKL5_04090 [Peribacillus sp. NPDC097675]|uniref:hypothetical protein n=1 Tax=Peribacillus sp. NPDC097675 TaxID=3390618 RepID=UPI003D036187